MTLIVVTIITGLFALATTVLTLYGNKKAAEYKVENSALADRASGEHADVLGWLKRIDARLDSHLDWHLSRDRSVTECETGRSVKPEGSET